ncbi:MAG: phosphate/phosphite/phosphonate ABC transporter substrate-binding protein [Planctomycetota bacterium]
MSKAKGMIGKGMFVALALVAVAAGSASYVASSWEQAAQRELESRTVSNVFANMATTQVLDEVYVDADGDLVADTPDEGALLAKPTELYFSFIASEDAANSGEVWKAVTDAIAEKTGLPVNYLQLDDSKAQIAALRSGQLHVTALSSGTVPTAVNRAGYVPLCTIGTPGEGESAAEFGYTMQFIVKADSKLKDIKSLQEKKIAFVRPRSNSGCKAAMILLKDQYGMLPERNYDWYYSYSHDASVQAVLSGKADAAPTASDILARMVAKEELQADSYRVLYESERFPPVAFGCAYNLPVEMRDAISAAMLELDWSGTKLAEEMAAGETKKFLPISYKDDWANIRRVDQAASNINSSLR